MDELLSGEKLLVIAEKENKSNIKNMCDMIFSFADICYLMLMFLPLYPYVAEGYIYSVNLFEYTQPAVWKTVLYWIVFSAFVVLGIVKLLLIKLKIRKSNKFLTVISVVLGIAVVLLLSLTREAYATVFVVILLTAKILTFRR